jgi:hypothetical protein
MHRAYHLSRVPTFTRNTGAYQGFREVARLPTRRESVERSAVQPSLGTRHFADELVR